MNKEILGVKAPSRNCTDQKCPFHGRLLVKKGIFPGKIIKKDTHKSATLEWFRSFQVPKYERYEMRRSRMHVHNPPCLDAQVGDEVIVACTRPLSKTKHHVIISVLKPTTKNKPNKPTTEKHESPQK